MPTQTQPNDSDKPALLKAIEIILADPAEIKKEVRQLINKLKKIYPDKSEEEIRDLAAEKVISNYSYFAAYVGAATGLTAVIPGLGQIIAAFGGAAADMALVMKFQIEMTMALAEVYGHDITDEETKRHCLIIAGLGVINEAAKKGGKEVGTKAFIKMAQQYLKGSTLQVVKQVFKKVGITFTRKSVEKAIPFGIGSIIGFSANKGLTWYVGTKARDLFKVY